MAPAGHLVTGRQPKTTNTTMAPAGHLVTGRQPKTTNITMAPAGHLVTGRQPKTTNTTMSPQAAGQMNIFHWNPGTGFAREMICCKKLWRLGNCCSIVIEQSHHSLTLLTWGWINEWTHNIRPNKKNVVVCHFIFLLRQVSAGGCFIKFSFSFSYRLIFRREKGPSSHWYVF